MRDKIQFQIDGVYNFHLTLNIHGVMRSTFKNVGTVVN